MGDVEKDAMLRHFGDEAIRPLASGLGRRLTGPLRRRNGLGLRPNDFIA